MKTQYPLFLEDNGTLTAILSDTNAFQYRDTDKASPKPKGYEFFTFTQRKTIRKFQQSGNPITLPEFMEKLNSAIELKRLILLNEISNVAWKAYEATNQTTHA